MSEDSTKPRSHGYPCNRYASVQAVSYIINCEGAGDVEQKGRSTSALPSMEKSPHLTKILPDAGKVL